MAWYQNGIGRWIMGVLIAEDEVIDAVDLDGDAHMTTSAECGRRMTLPNPCLFCRVVCGFIQSVLGLVWPHLKTHCANAWAAEKGVFAASQKLPGGND
jgi:hypothetical protein